MKRTFRALGTTNNEVVRLMMRRSVALAMRGVAVGILGSLALGLVLESLLFRATARDPVASILTALMLGVAAVAAAWTPAHQAGRVDPIVALRPGKTFRPRRGQL